MRNLIAIRREDKNEWERRTPLTPAHVAWLTQEQGVEVLVQPSTIRVFTNAAYAAAGATLPEDLSAAQVVLAIKEIPAALLQPNKTYLFFSHTIKGQAHNMPMLRRLLELNCQLIDYERVVDANNRRLIFFGNYAGYAGMVDTLVALGRRLAWEGVSNSFSQLQPTYTYADLPAAQAAVRQIGQQIVEEGLPPQLTPLVIGVAGYGNVSRGAQAILDLLPTRQISPVELLSLTDFDRNLVYKVVFKEEDTVEPLVAGATFNLQEFFQHPERYRSKFEPYLPHLAVLVNCIYWDARYPRLLTKAAAHRLFRADLPPRLRVIGDISCDIEGGIEPTLLATEPDAPAFVWNPDSDIASLGVAGPGLVIMAVDNLPCELPIESSTSFGQALLPLIPALAACDFSVPFDSCALLPELKRAMIVYQGALTPEYHYLEKFL
jgi:alpha-aminoadipic semialdehyde synthase